MSPASCERSEDYNDLMPKENCAGEHPVGEKPRHGRMHPFLTGPAEGSVEDFTLRDIPLYARKFLIGPLDQGLPAAFDRTPLPAGDPQAAPLVLTFCGDLMLWRRMPLGRGLLYAQLSEVLAASDFTLANLEFPVHPGEPPRGFPRFNGTRTYFEEVVLPLRPHVLSVANNHCLDQGAEGLAHTLELLTTHGILPLGVGCGDEGCRVMEIRGHRVAASACTFSTNGRPLPAAPTVQRLRLNASELGSSGMGTLVDTVASMRREADLVVLSLHWGFELERTPRINQVVLAHRLMDVGADVIAGHHPHVLQPVEHYRARDGRACLCLYTLGNWTSSMLPVCTRVTAAVQIGFTPGTGCTGLRAYPFYFDRSGPALRPLDGARHRHTRWVPEGLMTGPGRAGS